MRLVDLFKSSGSLRRRQDVYLVSVRITPLFILNLMNSLKWRMYCEMSQLLHVVDAVGISSPGNWLIYETDINDTICCLKGFG